MVYDVNGKSLNTNYVDVTSYGAKGDGITDDTSALQDALDSLKTTGGFIYFPAGVYKITEYLVYYSNQTLWFDGATLLQGAEINALLLARCPSGTTGYNGVHDVLIHGATFDGGDYTTNNTLSGCVHAKNITYEDCTFKNAYGTWHDLEFNSTYNGKVIRCDFEGSRKTGGNACLIQLDAIDRNAVYPWTDNQGEFDKTVCKYIEIASCIFHDDTISPAIGNHNSYAQLYTNIHDCVFDGFTASRGAINFITATNVDIHDNQFNGCTIGIGSGGSTYYIHDNRFVNVTTPSSIDSSVVFSNMENGEFNTIKIQNVSGSNVSITGVDNTRYICGEVATISITPPMTGIIDVVFTSGETATVLTLPQTVKMPSDFQVEAYTTYEINIMDGIYGTVMSWT